MLKRPWITQQLELHVTFQSGKTCIEQLGYINRGAGRDVFGNGTIAAKLQQWNYHEGSNAKEAAEILKVTKEWWNKWPDRVCRVLWCGRAELVAKWLKPPTELSCLLVEQQGEDLLCRVRRVANDAHQPVPQRMQRLYKIFRAFLEFFLEAWAAGIFIGDYGLRQICVRQGHPESGDSSLTAKNLVLVDVEGLTPRPSSGYAKLLTKMWKLVATELKAVLVQANISIAAARDFEGVLRSGGKLDSGGTTAVLQDFDALFPSMGSPPPPVQPLQPQPFTWNLPPPAAASAAGRPPVAPAGSSTDSGFTFPFADSPQRPVQPLLQPQPFTWDLPQPAAAGAAGRPPVAPAGGSTSGFTFPFADSPQRPVQLLQPQPSMRDSEQSSSEASSRQGDVVMVAKAGGESVGP